MRCVKPHPVLGTILMTALLVSAPAARAQTKEQKAGARAAAEAGGDAFDAGKYAEAADLFERAERLMHAPPHLLFGARAHAKLGHLVEARELYLALGREKIEGSSPRAFRDAVQMGEKELADIEPRIAYVSVVVQGGPPASSVQVTRNGQPVPPELLGVPTPINPGEYSYQARSDGMESTAASVKLREGARETVVLTLHALPGSAKKKSPPASSDEPAAGAGGSLTTSPTSDAPESGGRPLLIGSIASFGLGVAGGVVGTLFFVKFKDTQSQSNAAFDKCNPTRTCTQDDKDYINGKDSDAGVQEGIAIGSYVVGGLGIAAGVTLLVLDRGRSVASNGPMIVPYVGVNQIGAVGRF